MKALSVYLPTILCFALLTLPGIAAASDCDVAGTLPDNVSTATWYGHKFRGHRTTSGEIFDERKMTAAHSSLPLMSTVEITNLANGKTVRVRITDRGGMANASEIDLSESAAKSIGIHGCGLGLVVVSAPLSQAALQAAALKTPAASTHTGKHETSRSGSLLGRAKGR